MDSVEQVSSLPAPQTGRPEPPSPASRGPVLGAERSPSTSCHRHPQHRVETPGPEESTLSKLTQLARHGSGIKARGTLPTKATLLYFFLIFLRITKYFLKETNLSKTPMPSIVTSHPCSESRRGRVEGEKLGPRRGLKKPRRAGWGGRAAVTARGSAGQNSTKGSGQFSYEQGLQRAMWESPRCCAAWASASEPPAREAHSRHLSCCRWGN